MASSFIPQIIPAESWKQLTPNKAYAVRSNLGETVYFKFGPGGVYLAVMSSPQPGRVLSTIDIAKGTPALVGKMVEGEQGCIGRGSDCTVKINHAIMSRRHLEINLHGNILVIKDLGSTNGTAIYTENILLDIEDYIENHPPEKAAESTIDEYREAFGPALDDFLKKYSENKKG